MQSIIMVTASHILKKGQLFCGLRLYSVHQQQPLWGSLIKQPVPISFVSVGNIKGEVMSARYLMAAKCNVLSHYK